MSLSLATLTLRDRVSSIASRTYVDSLAPARLALRANLRLLHLALTLALGCVLGGQISQIHAASIQAEGRAAGNALRAALFAQDRGGSVRFSLSKGLLRISANAQGLGEEEEELEVAFR